MKKHRTQFIASDVVRRRICSTVVLTGFILCISATAAHSIDHFAEIADSPTFALDSRDAQDITHADSATFSLNSAPDVVFADSDTFALESYDIIPEPSGIAFFALSFFAYRFRKASFRMPRSIVTHPHGESNDLS